MYLNPAVVTTFWAIAGAVLYIAILAVALRHAAWWRLRNQQDLNVLLVASLSVFFIWMMEAGFSETLTLHLLGATVLTLMFGYAFALLGISLVIIGSTVFHGGSLVSLPWQGLLLGVLPVTISYTLFRFVDRHLPNNFFIYIFVCAFFGAALTMATVILATSAVHYLSGEFTFDYLQYNYFRYSLLLMFPEAFISGMLMSIFVAFRPEWVSTFDDARYLRRRDQSPQ